MGLRCVSFEYPLQITFWTIAISILVPIQSRRFPFRNGDPLGPDEECHQEGFFGSTSDCSKFSRCVPDPGMPGTFDKFTFDCPPGLIYDSRISGCNRVDAVQPKPVCFKNASESVTPTIHYPNNLLITGSKYGLVYFKLNTTDEANYEEIESLELHNVLVEPSILTNFLALTTNLQRLILRDVQFTSDFEDRVSLPHLKEFYLSHVNIIKIPAFGPFQLQANETTEISDFRTYQSMFRSLLFFYKENKWDWKIEELSSLKTNIEVVLHQTQLFKMNWREGYVYSRLMFTNEIIGNWDPLQPPLVKLVLVECPLNIDAAPTTLKSIDLRNVTYGNGTSSDLLRKNKGLESVRIWFKPNSGYPTVYLSDVPKRIEFLRIGHGSIVKSEINPVAAFPVGSFERHLEFLHLDTLVFSRCQIEDEVAKDFSIVFKTKEVWIGFEPQNQQYLLLGSMLRGNEKLAVIGMKGFTRNPNPRPANFEEIEMFLRSTGVPNNGTEFELEKKNGTWEECWCDGPKIF